MTRTVENQPLIEKIADHQRTTWEERWQSFKVGGLGAIAAALIFGLMVQVNSWATLSFPELDGLVTWQAGVAVIVSGAIAKFSGFLFAVTYRYIIRQDQNPHLRSGAVGAFGLVRGLALAEMTWQEASPWVLAVLLLESFALFGGIRMVLDWAFAQGWLQPFEAPVLLGSQAYKSSDPGAARK
ncbi:MAG: hypothetical protein NW224_26085 [Leptolyngbyaceae cyanobacterium bins.302]|nr:hypothetical protein [Leptolyngbyaceae cyanobacterium bins.302]